MFFVLFFSLPRFWEFKVLYTVGFELKFVSFYYFEVFLRSVVLFADYIFITLYIIFAEKMFFIVIVIVIECTRNVQQIPTYIQKMY